MTTSKNQTDEHEEWADCKYIGCPEVNINGLEWCRNHYPGNPLDLNVPTTTQTETQTWACLNEECLVDNPLGNRVCADCGNSKAYISPRIEARLEEFTAHTNAEIAKVLDRLEAQWGETIDNTLGKPIRIKFVSVEAIAAERAKLKEVK